MIMTSPLTYFLGCARCSKWSCQGFCGQMKEWTSVECIWTYNNWISQKLVEAKHTQNPVTIAQLTLVCFEEYQFRLERRLNQEKCITVVLPICKIRKQTMGFWHPTFWILRAIEAWETKHKLKVSRLTPMTFNWDESNVSLKKTDSTYWEGQKSESLIRWKQNLTDFEPSALLFVDDVLTSGRSAARLQQNLPHSLRHVPQHMLVMFRAPPKEPLN